MADEPTDEFSGCARECQGGVHSLVWGRCVLATPPEPRLTITGKRFIAEDGSLSVGSTTYTRTELIQRIVKLIQRVRTGKMLEPHDCHRVAEAIVDDLIPGEEIVDLRTYEED